jgi:ethanolamine utilization protein EutQ (cupin superfamily)
MMDGWNSLIGDCQILDLESMVRHSLRQSYFSGLNVSTSLALVVPQMVFTVVSEPSGVSASLTAVSLSWGQETSRTKSIPSGGKLSSVFVAIVVDVDSPLQIEFPVLVT